MKLLVKGRSFLLCLFGFMFQQTGYASDISLSLNQGALAQLVNATRLTGTVTHRVMQSIECFVCAFDREPVRIFSSVNSWLKGAQRNCLVRQCGFVFLPRHTIKWTVIGRSVSITPTGAQLTAGLHLSVSPLMGSTALAPETFIIPFQRPILITYSAATNELVVGISSEPIALDVMLEGSLQNIGAINLATRFRYSLPLSTGGVIPGSGGLAPRVNAVSVSFGDGAVSISGTTSF